MSKERLPRKTKKRLGLFKQQLDIWQAMGLSPNEIAVELDFETPYQTIDQARHERRVFGHTNAECMCTPEEVNAAVLWNQPPASWVGSDVAAEYHRRQHRRRS